MLTFALPSIDLVWMVSKKMKTWRGDINVLINNEPDNVNLVTLAVNGGDNGLHERVKIYEAIRKEWELT
jgi:predicted chitinase